MISSMTARVLTAGALAAALAWGGTGTAIAAPPEGTGPVRSTDGSAFAVLSTSAEPELGIILDVFDPQDQPAFAGLDVFFGAYECQTDAPIPATLDGVDSASAAGTLSVTCGGVGVPEVTGYAEVDVQWTGEGRISRSTVAGPQFCVSRTQAREAEVTGTVRLVIEALGVDVVTTPEFGELRLTRSICPPSRG
jgi:hypothetical protein